MNAPRTEAIIKKRGEIRDHALYELCRENEDALNKIKQALKDSQQAGELGDSLRWRIAVILNKLDV